jgi:hypothetical protein
MTVCGGQRREGRHRIWRESRHGNRRNAGDAENGIEQRAIFGAQAVNFSALVVDFGAPLRKFVVERALGARGHTSAEDFHEFHR